MNTLTRKSEILLIVYIAKKHENRTESIRITLKRSDPAQLGEILGFLSPRQKDRSKDANFVLVELQSQDDKSHLIIGRKRYRGIQRPLWASFAPGGKVLIFGVVRHCVEPDIPTLCALWSSERWMRRVSPPRWHSKAGSGYPQRSRPPTGLSGVNLGLHLFASRDNPPRGDRGCGRGLQL